jgi:DNA polymerase III alpha subunit
VLEDNPPKDVIPLLDFDVEKAPQDCPATWALLGRGETKGVFQLESNLGKTWSRKLKPEAAEHMSALGALLRPGCLKAVDEHGVSMTKHYVLRKNGEEAVSFYHPALEPILFPTYGVLVYQEQAMAIAQAIAGFNLQEADQLRKAIGKKLPVEMAKCKKLFAEGAARLGLVTLEQAEEIFGWIEKSQRYSFNKSHSMCYGMTGYECAYIKAHFPVAFFTSWLYNARHKRSKDGPQQERFELVNDARLFDIVVEAPDLRSLERFFHTDRKTVKFGLSDIKGVGEAQIKKLRDVVAEAEQQIGKALKEWSWFDFLLRVASRLPSNVIVSLIEVGALRWLPMSRQRMVAEFKAWSSLTDKEREWISETHAGTGMFRDGFSDLIEAMKGVGRPKKEGGGCSNKNRVSSVNSQVYLLEHPPASLEDTPHWIAWVEEELLGISISCSKIDACDISQVNVSCKEYLAGRTGFLMFGVEVQQVREVKTKKGKAPGSKMAFLTIADASCSVDDVICFPETWKEYSSVLTEGNTVIMQAERDTGKKDSTGLLVKKVWQANISVA